MNNNFYIVSQDFETLDRVLSNFIERAHMPIFAGLNNLLCANKIVSIEHISTKIGDESVGASLHHSCKFSLSKTIWQLKIDTE